MREVLLFTPPHFHKLFVVEYEQLFDLSVLKVIRNKKSVLGGYICIRT
jgi:hypothetical protein